MTPEQLESISDLASRVERLGPDRRNPERFHEEKSEIASGLRQLLESGDDQRPHTHRRAALPR
jgi:hypothetical protein